MGQYYIAVILDSAGKFIRTWIEPHNYNNGAKLMEHSYVENEFVSAVEGLLCPEGMFYKSPLVWAGDYADPEPEEEANLNKLTGMPPNEKKAVRPEPKDMSDYRYIVNHTKAEYVDKNYGKPSIHPLPLLTAAGNGRGGGDYMGDDMELVGIWSGDVISLEKEIPFGYKELVCEFAE
jgi:hypothetical protein